MKHNRGTWLFFLATMVIMELAIYWAFLGAPTEKSQGDVQRIFYFHLGSIAVSFFGFFYVCYASVRFLLSKDLKWDAKGFIAGEAGLVLSTIVLVTGPIWAKPTWGVWWAWDARLTSMLVLWFIFLFYAMLDDYVVSDLKLPRIRAVFGIIGAAMVPFVYMSTRWFETQHPKPVIAGGEDSGMEPGMWIALLFALAGFTAVYILFCKCGGEIRRMGTQVKVLSRELRELEELDYE